MEAFMPLIGAVQNGLWNAIAEYFYRVTISQRSTDQ